MKIAPPWISHSNERKKIIPHLIDQVASDYDGWQLSVQYVQVAGVKTAVYIDTASQAATTLLFVHGIGGDYHGMVPLAYCLKDTYRVAFVDLPGHGRSAIPPTDSLAFLEQWSGQLHGALGFPISMVIAHSFGCFSAQFMQSPLTCYINPPLSLAPAVLNYSFRLYSVRHLASLVYNIRPYALWRGQQLVHELDGLVRARITWVTDATKISRDQFLFQAQLARHTTDGRQLLLPEHIDRVGSSFVLSRFDKIATISPEQERRIATHPVLRLPDDHLSILESPEVIARALTDWLSNNSL